MHTKSPARPAVPPTRHVRDLAMLAQLHRDDRFAAVVSAAVAAQPSWREELALAFDVYVRQVDLWADGRGLVHYKVQRQVQAWIWQRAARASGSP